MARLFLSYARSDGSQLAERLEVDLQASGHEPWRDQSEIRAGRDWAREIEKAIDRCEMLLAVFTTGSYNSEICRGEHERALRMRKRVIPLLAHKDADRPVYLEAKHYVDFTDTDRYDTSFEALLTSIQTAGGMSWDELSPRFRVRLVDEAPIRSSGALLRRRQAMWSEVYSLTSMQRTRFLEALSPRPGTVGIFEPALYTPRTEVESELDEFISSNAHSFILIGDTGVGKTNLLCEWSGRQSADGHAVLMYHCDRLGSETAERELMKDFGMEDPGDLTQVLGNLEELARKANRLLIVIFDGINDFRGSGERHGPQQLLTSIDSLVARLPGAHLRIVLSCSTATWNRLERLGPVQLTWSRYYRTRSEEVAVVLKSFYEEEAAAAFESYRQFFKLTFTRSDLPFALRVRLRAPLVLRLLAETYQAAPDRSAAPTFDTLVFTRYYNERVRRRDDRHLIDALVEEMLEQGSAALPIESLTGHPQLGPAVLSEAADSSYNRLLDLGVLLEMPGDLFQDDVVKFTYPLVGAYALARRLSREERPLSRTVHELLEQAGSFPLAWDAAVTLLAMRGDIDVYAELAGSSNPEQRELASTSLVRLQDSDRDRATGILKGLLDSELEEHQRTALRAAFTIGPDARELLLHGATSKSQALQQAVKDTLFLIWSGESGTGNRPNTSTVYFLWRHAQNFTQQLMSDLVARVSWKRPAEAIRITRFVLDWCITLYINHCDRDDVAKQVADLFYELIVDRLHLDRIDLGSRFDRIVLRIIASVFARPILEWTLMEDPRHFFRRPASERSLLESAAPLVDPAADIIAADDLVLRMLTSGINTLRGTATLVLAVHSCAEFARCEALHRRLFDALDRQGQVWQLIGFSVLLPETPVAWVSLLEDMTRRILKEVPQPVNGRAGLLRASDLLFVPLGLAYGKRGEGMPLFEEMLAAEASKGVHGSAATHLVAGLGPVGFYYPRGVLASLQPHLTALMARSNTRDALMTALATIRTLHFDLVDTFMFRAGLDESFHRKVAVITDVQLINRFMLSIGLYNNAVHQCLHYPRMRRWLTRFPLERLAQADSASDFITAYAARALLMAREANFHLLELTLPE